MPETRTRIKICGITNIEDARAAIDYGADALGFIFVPDTPRYIGDCADLLDELHLIPPFVNRVAVCLTPEHLPEQEMPDFDTIQFYSTRWDCRRYGARRWVQAFRIREESSLDEIAAALKTAIPDALLLDTYHKDRLGGSGKTFNWELAKEAKARFGLPIILAGGLTPDNVGDAIAAVRPYAVDVSSGVEAEPGRKDHAKLKAFLRAVRQADST
jgi:phosphoribosylanthranilate isomerase